MGDPLAPRLPASLLHATRNDVTDAPLPVVAGALPAELRGHLFVVAPVGTVAWGGRPRPGQPPLLNGDGMICRVDLDGGAARATCRLARSPCQIADELTHGAAFPALAPAVRRRRHRAPVADHRRARLPQHRVRAADTAGPAAAPARHLRRRPPLRARPADARDARPDGRRSRVAAGGLRQRALSDDPLGRPPVLGSAHRRAVHHQLRTLAVEHGAASRAHRLARTSAGGRTGRRAPAASRTWCAGTAAARSSTGSSSAPTDRR